MTHPQILWSLIATVFLAGCSEDRLGPSLDVHSDPVLARQAAGTTAMGGADLDALRGSAWLRRQLNCLGIDLAARETELRERTALQHDRFDLRQLGLGCGDGGCALLGRGQVAPEALPALGAAALPGQTVQQTPDPRGLAGRLPRGEHLRLRLDRDGWLLGGDQGAVASLDTAAERLDPTPLVDAIPAGELWIAGYAPQRLFAAAARRLERNGGPAALELATQLRTAEGPQAVAARLAETVALSLQLTPQPVLRLRVRTRSSRLATEVSTRLRAALLFQRWRPGQDPRLKALLENAEVLRADRRVEVVAPLPDLCQLAPSAR